jgi:predicted ester cyclase
MKALSLSAAGTERRHSGFPRRDTLAAAHGDTVTTFKTYYGTHKGPFLGVAATGTEIHFESVDVMRVQNGKITDHWGVSAVI